VENLSIRPVNLKGKIKDKINNLLHSNGLSLEPDLDYTLVAELNGEIVATGSLSGPVIKCLATDWKHKGMGLNSKIITLLLEEASRIGFWHVFLYTKPHNIEIFNSLGFTEVARVNNRVVLFETGTENIKDFVKNLKTGVNNNASDIASIVVNCNPFTKGHLYLIEKAARESDWVHIFVVSEDLSLFPYKKRIELVKLGTRHLKNVTVHEGGQYIISRSTFPSYFIREVNEHVYDHAMLDLTIFGEYIVPALNIKKRYVGHEPYCPLTNIYNEIMLKKLPEYGVKVLVIPRLTIDGEAISASNVRQAIREDNWELIEKLLPSTTINFLRSEEGEPIIKKIKENESPH
jgi:[citrate (pro-3S)-lyase] ligase